MLGTVLGPPVVHHIYSSKAREADTSPLTSARMYLAQPFAY